MALQVWLPLNGNLDQQGIADVTITNYGATVDNAGKIGKCYKLDGTDDRIQITNLPNPKNVTVAFWMKRGATTNTRQFMFTAWGGVTCELSANNTLHCYVYGGGGACDSSTAITVDTGWVHVVYSFEDCVGGKLYINGSLHKSTASTGSISWTTTTGNIGCYSNIYYNGYINDFRFYDHVLSPREVAEIAKGLVVHYPLSDPYIESTTNLITTEDCLSNTCYNGATSKYSYGTSTDMYKTVTTYDGKKGTKVYMGTNGNSCYPYVYVNNMFTSDGSNAPAYKTLSFDYYGTVGNYLGPYKLGSGEGTATYTVTCQGIKTTGTYSNSGYFTVTPNKWNHIEITFHGTTAANSEWGYIRIGNGNHTSNTSNFWFFANMQLEAKDHATGYEGVGNTRTATTVYDTSGFGNNGTTVGEFEIASESPRYSGCAYIKKTSNITHPRCLDNTDQEWTCCAWVKLDASTQFQPMNNFNGNNYIVYATTPLLYLNAGANDYYMYGSEVVPAGTWTHIAFVFKNSTGLRNIYINGVLKNSSGPNKTSTPLGIPDTVILFNNPFSGYVSDYREYTTALTADQVKQLYEAPISLANNGTLFANEFNET